MWHREVEWKFGPSGPYVHLTCPHFCCAHRLMHWRRSKQVGRGGGALTLNQINRDTIHVPASNVSMWRPKSQDYFGHPARPSIPITSSFKKGKERKGEREWLANPLAFWKQWGREKVWLSPTPCFAIKGKEPGRKAGAGIHLSIPSLRQAVGSGWGSGEEWWG